MTLIRSLDHVAIAVHDTELALRHFRDVLGLPVVHQEENASARVRLTYLSVGNAFLQLVEPLDEGAAVAAFLREHGEGVHHVCFGVDDVRAGAAALGGVDAEAITMGSGRGHPSAFAPGEPVHGLRIECTRVQGG